MPRRDIVTIGTEVTHGLSWLWQHLHDASVSALAAAVVTLGVVLLMELRSVMRLRHVVDRNLSRVFEQLDLLRFETQQLLEGQQSLEASGRPGAATASTTPPATVSSPALVPGRAVVPTLVPAAVAAVAAVAAAPALVASPVAAIPMASSNAYQNAAALAVGGASSREIAERLGLATGEARLLSSLALARARRAAAAGV
jgi:hypothetical protein